MKYILLAILCFTLFSCDKTIPEPINPLTGYLKIGEQTTTQNLKVSIYTKDTIRTGYTKFYIKLDDATGTAVSNATLNLSSLMTMTTMSHSSPVEQPIYNATTKLYEGAVVFTMPSGTDSWTTTLQVNGEPKIFPVNVLTTVNKMVGSYTGTDGAKYILSLVPLQRWQVGINDIEIAVHKRESMMSFPPDNTFEIVMTPEMPSMGHGSPNNINPVNIGNGHYKGKVNFTMTGDWKVNFVLKKNGTEIVNNAYIDLVF